MEVTFDEAELAALCSSEHQMVRRWGRDGFEYVGRRLFELAGAADLDHVAALPGAVLHRDGTDRVTITFDHGDLVVAAEMIAQPGVKGTATTIRTEGLHIIHMDAQRWARTS